MRGLKCKLYYDSASNHASPTWTALNKVRDVDIPDSRTMGDSSTREEDIASETPGLRKISCSTDLIFKEGDSTIEDLQDAYDNGTILDLFFANEPGGVGSTGRRGDFYVSKWDRKEPMEGAVMVSIAFSRTADGGHTYGAYTYPGS